jgi:hypothetical protein
VNGVPPRLLDPDGRRSRTRQAAVVALLLGAASLVDPSRPLPFDVCLFKRLTGLPCQTCGLTRALCHAVHGNWAQSVACHPAGLVLAAALAGWMLWSAAEAYRGQRLGERLRGRLGTALLGAGVALSLVSWVLRLAGVSQAV